MSFDPDLVAEAIVEVVKAAVAPVVADLKQLRAELRQTPPVTPRLGASDEDTIADVIVQGIKKAIAPTREDQTKLRAELVMLRVELTDLKTRVAALDVADGPAPLARHTLQ